MSRPRRAPDTRSGAGRLPELPGASSRSWPASLAVSVAAFALYLWLAPPVSADRDSSEFTLVLAFDGVAHPTGYLLYTAFGHAFVRALNALGAGLPFAANAWSAFGGAVAMGLLHELAARMLPRGAAAAQEGRWLPLLPVALVLVHPAWTQVATVAEVHSWQMAWALAMVLATLVAASGQGAAHEGLLPAIGLGLLAGSGLAHHATSALVAAPLGVAWIAGRRARTRDAAVFALAAAVPLLASLALLRLKLSHPGPAQWVTLENTWGAAWAHMTGAQYGGLFGRFAPEPLERELILRTVFPYVLPGLLALAAVWRLAPSGHERRVSAGLFVAAMAQTAFAFAYGVEDPSAYFLPALFLGVAACASVLARLAVAPAGRGAARAALVTLALVACALAPGWVRSARELRATFIGLDGFVHEQWLRIHDGQAVVLWPRDMHQRLVEYQLVRGEKPGLEVWNPWLLMHPAARRRFVARHGFDPLAGLSPGREALLAPAGESAEADRFVRGVARNIHERSPLPVILFEPEIPRVTRLAPASSPPATP